MTAYTATVPAGALASPFARVSALRYSPAGATTTYTFVSHAYSAPVSIRSPHLAFQKAAQSTTVPSIPIQTTIPKLP